MTTRSRTIIAAIGGATLIIITGCAAPATAIKQPVTVTSTATTTATAPPVITTAPPVTVTEPAPATCDTGALWKAAYDNKSDELTAEFAAFSDYIARDYTASSAKQDDVGIFQDRDMPLWRKAHNADLACGAGD